MSESASPAPKRLLRRYLVGVWVVGLVAALAAGAWVRHERVARSERDGRDATERASQLARSAQDAEAAGELERAVEDTRQVVALLRTTDGARDATPYAVALVDLASRVARGDEADALSAAATLLEEAWALPGNSPALAGRIARDRGAVELLRGDPASAQQWYERASMLDGAPSPRSQALRESGAWQDPDGR